MGYPSCKIMQLGLVPYQKAWDLQEQLAGEISQGLSKPVLLLLEHPHTYTIGTAGHIENLLWSQAEVQRRGIAIFRVDRGGDITYHGPGQLVGYPLISLTKITPAKSSPINQEKPASRRIPRNDYIAYLRSLEEVLILTLQSWDISGLRIPGQTGVWVQIGGRQPAKIASIGIKVDARGVTRHGFSLNVSPDMSYWEGIVPCGLEGSAQTSIAELLPSSPGMTAVMDAIVDCFSHVFGFSIDPGGHLG